MPVPGAHGVTGPPLQPSPFVNPIGPGLSGERVDMGVDYGGKGPLYALGSGVITAIANSGWPGGTFIGLHLDSGQYMYYAEDIAPAVRVGQRVSAGQLVGTATGGSSGIEVGWAAPPGTGQTMAAQAGQIPTSGDPGAHATAYGESMSNLIASLGGPKGVTTGQIVGTVPGDYFSASPDASTSAAGLGAGCVPMVYSIYLVWGFLCRAASTREGRGVRVTPPANGRGRFGRRRRRGGRRSGENRCSQ